MTVQPEPGSDHFDRDGRSITDWARRLYPGGHHTNLAGQPVWGPPLGECRFCGTLLADSVCEGQDLHCQSCRDDANCPACNGAPS